MHISNGSFLSNCHFVKVNTGLFQVLKSALFMQPTGEVHRERKSNTLKRRAEASGLCHIPSPVCSLYPAHWARSRTPVGKRTRQSNMQLGQLLLRFATSRKLFLLERSQGRAFFFEAFLNYLPAGESQALKAGSTRRMF